MCIAAYNSCAGRWKRKPTNGDEAMEPWNGEQRSLVDQWLAALDDSHWNTRATAVHMLGELGELTPLEPLLASLNDEDESVRAATVRALGKLGERAPVDRLVMVLSDPSWMVREMASLTVGELGERMPPGPLLDILHAAHEDTFVREAAQMALQQAHTEIVSSLAQDTAITPQARDQSPARTERHHLVKSSQARLIGLAKRFFPLHTAMQEADVLVEISDLATAAHSSLPLQPPVLASSRRSLPLRIAEGLLVTLLILGIGLSWLLLAQKLHLSYYAGPTPTASPSVSLSWQGHSLSLKAVNGVVYVGAMDNAVYALRASDGGLLWRYTTAGPVNDPPVVVDGIVYVNANVDQGLGYLTGYVYALRASDGALLWRYTNGSFVYNGYVYQPTVVAGEVYIASQDGTLSALRASTGFSGPTILDGVVYTLAAKYSPDTTDSTHTGGYALQVAASKFTAPINTKIPFKQGGPSSLYALRASDGTVLWHYQAPDDKNNGVGLLAVVGRLVYIDTTAGPSKTIISALRASDGSLLWSYPTEASADNFLVTSGVAYLTSTDGTVAALRTTNGALLWHYTIPGQVFNTPLVDGDTVYIGAANGIVYALQATTGVLRWSYHTKVS